MAKIKFAAFGDSLTEGYGLAAYSSLPAQLERKLLESGTNIEINNFGISGDTTSDGLNRISEVINSNPDAAYIEFGANDCFQLISPDEVYENLSKIIDVFNDHNIPVMLIGFVPFDVTPHSYRSEFSTIYIKLRNKYGIKLYPNILKGIENKPELFQHDGVHPDVEGVEIIVKNLIDDVKAFLSAL